VVARFSADLEFLNLFRPSRRSTIHPTRRRTPAAVVLGLLRIAREEAPPMADERIRDDDEIGRADEDDLIGSDDEFEDNEEIDDEDTEEDEEA
jgi:hypothetical protein